MKMIYNVEDKPGFGKVLVFALQQLLAIMAATLTVPIAVNGTAKLTGADAMSPAAALLGAGLGTLVYVLFTKAKSPVFLGSSFAFIPSMCAAFAGAAMASLGYIGLILGAVMAGLVYVIISIVVKLVGVNWINKLMPPVVIGPTVAIIGLSLSGSAVSSMMTTNNSSDSWGATLISILCGVVTLFVTMICSSCSKKGLKLIPFICGIAAGYVFAAILTVIGKEAGIEMLQVTDFSALKDLFSTVSVKSFVDVPKFTFLSAKGAFKAIDGSYISSIAFAYVPVAFVVFAEHIADHKNISSIIERDLLQEPGLSRTLLGDGVGSMVGAFFGGCPNTTYGESIACVAVSQNASVITIITAAIGAVILAFFSPFVALVNTIPSCVMGGVCVALYGFIAVSGLKMFKDIDLGKNRNLFVVSTILVTGIGGLSLNFGKITITNIATALILGILVNVMLSAFDKNDKENDAE